MADLLMAGIVTYNPDIILLKNELDQLNKLEIPIVVVDNCSNNISNICDLIPYYNNIKLIKNNGNLGIACAQNKICEYAFENNYKYVLTLDQDSIIPNDISKLIGDFDENIGIVSPFIKYIGKIYSYIPDGIIEKEWVISSGSIINVNAWKLVNGFDDEMFIDLVDFDFCFRLKKRGYKIIQNNQVVMEHHLGELCERRFLFWKLKIGNHSPIRKYYKSRNLVYLYRKKEVSFAKMKIEILKMKLEIFYEKNKSQKRKMIKKGIRDAKNMKLPGGYN